MRENENTKDCSTIEFIFAKPYSEHTYLYSVNSTDTFMFIDKEVLNTLIFEKLGCRDYEKAEFVLRRNLPFLYDNRSKHIRKFKDISDTDESYFINQIIGEMKDSISEKAMTSPYEKLMAINACGKNTHL